MKIFWNKRSKKEFLFFLFIILSIVAFFSYIGFFIIFSFNLHQNLKENHQKFETNYHWLFSIILLFFSILFHAWFLYNFSLKEIKKIRKNNEKIKKYIENIIKNNSTNLNKQNFSFIFEHSLIKDWCQTEAIKINWFFQAVSTFERYSIDSDVEGNKIEIIDKYQRNFIKIFDDLWKEKENFWPKKKDKLLISKNIRIIENQEKFITFNDKDIKETIKKLNIKKNYLILFYDHFNDFDNFIFLNKYKIEKLINNDYKLLSKKIK